MQLGEYDRLNVVSCLARYVEGEIHPRCSAMTMGSDQNWVQSSEGNRYLGSLVVRINGRAGQSSASQGDIGRGGINAYLGDRQTPGGPHSCGERSRPIPDRAGRDRKT